MKPPFNECDENSRILLMNKFSFSQIFTRRINEERYAIPNDLLGSTVLWWKLGSTYSR